jgi:glycosyltransferase involved in cell wall biosynthesis
VTTTPTSVAFCENGAGYGGAIISLAAMLEQLDQRFKPLLYTSLGTEPYRQLERLGRWQQLAPVDLIERRKLQSYRVPFASMIDNLCNLLPYAMKYYWAFKQQRVRIVYLNNDASCNAAAALAARMADLPLVLHARGFHADTRSNRMVLSWLDHCMPVSHAVKRQLLQLGLPEEKCTVVPEGLDLEIFHPREPVAGLREELELPLDSPLITLVGGLIDWKGQDVLLDAAPQIFARHPNARILLVGAAYGRDDSFARQIAQRIASPEMGGRVLLLGGRKDIAELLSISSVVVHASTQPEPFGRTFLEGMALGRPVIASNEGGPLDVITHEHDGLLIAPREPGLLARSVLRILDNPEWAAQMADNGAETARLYSIQQHTDAISTILQRLV